MESGGNLGPDSIHKFLSFILFIISLRVFIHFYTLLYTFYMFFIHFSKVFNRQAENYLREHMNFRKSTLTAEQIIYEEVRKTDATFRNHYVDVRCCLKHWCGLLLPCSGMQFWCLIFMRLLCRSWPHLANSLAHLAIHTSHQ